MTSGPFTMLQSLLNCVVDNDNHRSPLPVLAPLFLALDFVLLEFKSGDVFTLYLERRG